jgi:hypothetical protein
MVRLLIAALICITIYSIYYDLSSGTIPEPSTPAATQTSAGPMKNPVADKETALE